MLAVLDREAPTEGSSDGAVAVTGSKTDNGTPIETDAGLISNLRGDETVDKPENARPKPSSADSLKFAFSQLSRPSALSKSVDKASDNPFSVFLEQRGERKEDDEMMVSSIFGGVRNWRRVPVFVRGAEDSLIPLT